MRKGQLLEQNMSLFNQLQESRAMQAQLERELEEKNSRIAQLEKELNAAKANMNVTEPIRKLEEKMTVNRCVDDDTEYGAAVIGKIVIDAARLSGELSADGENARELINLILGRTEVAKSEIMDIVVSERDSEAKRKLIDMQYTESSEYFESIMAQR